MNHNTLNHWEGVTSPGAQNQEAFEAINKLPSTKDMQKMKQKIADIFSRYFLHTGVSRKGNDISDNILGDSMSEIALCIMQKNLAQAQLLRGIIESLYTKIQDTSNLDPIIQQFEYIKNKKLGHNGEMVYKLQEGENRLLMLKSAIDGLE